MLTSGIEVLNHPQLAVRQACEAAGYAGIPAMGHVDVVSVGRTFARSFREHHGQAAIDDGFGVAVPTWTLVLGALAALTEGSMGGSGRPVSPGLGGSAPLGVRAPRDGSHAHARPKFVAALHAELTSA